MTVLTTTNGMFLPTDARRWPHRKKRLYMVGSAPYEDHVITRVDSASTVVLRRLPTDMRGWY